MSYEARKKCLGDRMPKPGFEPKDIEAEYKRRERMTEPTRPVAEWEDHGTYEDRLVAIVYPRDSYFELSVLRDGKWEDVQGKGQDTEERAMAQAQTLANKSGLPHAVRVVLPK